MGTPGAISGPSLTDGTPDPNWYSYSLTVSPYCASDPAFSSDPTANRTSFLNTPGQSWLDTINWEVNPTVGPNAAGCPSPYFYCQNPDYGDSELGSGYPGNFPTGYPTNYGGGVNGTGYTWGSTPASGSFPANPLNLSITNTFGSMPTYPYQNMLTGTADGVNDLALTWDTFTTTSTYNIGGNSGECQNLPNYPVDLTCWNPGPESNAPISGIGFDIQLGNFGQNLGPFSVTFNVYGATANCGNAGNGQGGYSGDTIVAGETAGTLADCYDYQNGEMTDSNGADTANDGPVSGNQCTGDGDTACPEYNSSTAQLLGTITVNSDDLGDPAFVGFTTTDPYGIGALVMTGFSAPFGESADANFSIDEVTLLTPTPPSTPEPATLLLFGSGLLIAARRLRKRVTK